MDPIVITVEQYLMGRDRRYAKDYSQDIARNAIDLVMRLNRLMPYITRYVDVEMVPGSNSLVSSGWRPKGVNATTPGAALRSLHITAQAVDLYDPDGVIDGYLWEHQDMLAQPDIDLYMEHPSATKGWCHLQSVPPKSQRLLPANARRRWFYP